MVAVKVAVIVPVLSMDDTIVVGLTTVEETEVKLEVNTEVVVVVLVVVVGGGVMVYGVVFTITVMLKRPPAPFGVVLVEIARPWSLPELEGVGEVVEPSRPDEELVLLLEPELTDELEVVDTLDLEVVGAELVLDDPEAAEGDDDED